MPKKGDCLNLANISRFVFVDRDVGVGRGLCCLLIHLLILDIPVVENIFTKEFDHFPFFVLESQSVTGRSDFLKLQTWLDQALEYRSSFCLY